MPLLTEDEVCYYLEVSPHDLQKLVKRGKLTAYRLGGSYLRFRKEEILALRNGKKFIAPDKLSRNSLDKVRDFWKFYNFYIISSLVVLFLALLCLQL